jgi:hypothetical protein
MKKQACSINERLSKNTFLTMLGEKRFVKPPEYDDKESYYYKGALYKKTANEEYSVNKIRAYFEKLDSNSWSIRSFDSSTREVCIEIKNNYGIRNISVILPQLI